MVVAHFSIKDYFSIILVSRTIGRGGGNIPQKLMQDKVAGKQIHAHRKVLEKKFMQTKHPPHPPNPNPNPTPLNFLGDQWF